MSLLAADIWESLIFGAPKVRGIEPNRLETILGQVWSACEPIRADTGRPRDSQSPKTEFPIDFEGNPCLADLIRL